MFCSNCGTQTQNGVAFCPNCGNPIGQGQNQQYSAPPPQQPQYQQQGPPQYQTQQSQYQQPMQYNQVQSTDDKVGLLAILFFLFPIIGFIMFFVWKKTKPLKAGKAIKYALFGFIVGMAVKVMFT